jgi:predicted nucleic acid-binding protein
LTRDQASEADRTLEGQGKRIGEYDTLIAGQAYNSSPHFGHRQSPLGKDSRSL